MGMRRRSEMGAGEGEGGVGPGLHDGPAVVRPLDGEHEGLAPEGVVAPLIRVIDQPPLPAGGVEDRPMAL